LGKQSQNLAAMRILLFCSLLCIGLLACVAPNPYPLLKKSPYDSSVSHYAGKLDGKKKKSKHVKGLESAFQSAQRADLLAADSLLNLDAPDRWLYLNALHRRIQDRQAKVVPLLPLRADDGYRPDLLLVTDIAERESASRRAAATYLYDRANALLAETESSGRKQPARDAYYTLRDLKDNYYRYWENANALIDSAFQAGQAHVLLESDARGSLSFWQPGTLLAPLYFNTEWLRFYQYPNARAEFDFRVKSRLTEMHVGPENRWETIFTETKQIEVGHKEVRDSTGNVVERTPIYETVCATVTEVHVTKSASATLYVEISDERSGRLVGSEWLSDHQNYDETFVRISGDERALTHRPFTTIGCPSVPSDWAMEDRLVSSLQGSLAFYCRRTLAGR
jgi:hypothetical protein